MNWTAFLTARRDFRRELRKAKAVSWQKFTSNLKTPRDLARLYKGAQAQENKRLDLLRGSGDDPSKTLDMLLDTLFPNSIKGQDHVRHPKQPKQFADLQEGVRFITEEKVKWGARSGSTG